MANSGVLFYLFAERKEIESTLAPLVTGVKVNGMDVQLAQTDLDLAEASMEHMLDQVAQVRNSNAVALAPAAMATSTATTASSDGKAPKTAVRG